jgi:membrane protease YdiL (CAAX protease family)
MAVFGIALVFATVFPLSYLDHLFVSDATDIFSIGTALAIAAIGVPLAIITLFMRLMNRDWADYGLKSIATWKAVLLVLVVAIATIALMKFALIPLFKAIAPVRPDIGYLMPVRGNLPGFLFVLLVVWTTAAFGEELIFRGFVLNELAGLLGGSEGARWTAAIATGVLFGVGHLHQGLSGVLASGATGCIFGAAYLLLRRNLYPLIIAHGLVDTLSITSIYLA